MKILGIRHTLLAGAALLAAGVFSPVPAQADMSFLGHPAPTLGHILIYPTPVYAYQVPTYYYVPATPKIVVPQAQPQPNYLPPPVKEEDLPPVSGLVEKPEAVQPKAAPQQQYSNFYHAPGNPVVMVYPPMVMGYGQPVIVW